MGSIKKTRINKQIREAEVRVIGEDGQQLGILAINEALRIAAEKSLDLVEVAPNSAPPVCRIMDYGRFKYMQNKKEQEQRKKQVTVQLKEVKLRPNTEDHDLDHKLRNVRRFLEEGQKTKIMVVFRGREIFHPEMGTKILHKIRESVADCATVEKDASLEGRMMTMILGPGKSAK